MIITLSRQLGAGARSVGERLSAELSCNFLDNSLIPEVAQRLQTTEESVEILDEHPDSLLTRVLRAFYASAPETSMTVDTVPDITADDVATMTRSVIADMAGSEPLVITGRGARWVVGDRPDAPHVHLIAPFEVRARRVARKEGMNLAEAEKLVHQTDRYRAAYIRQYHHADWHDPQNYHLVINTARPTLDGVVAIIKYAAALLVEPD